jgi:hypothetical protein
MSTYIRILLDGAGLAVQCDHCGIHDVHRTYEPAKQALLIHKLEHAITNQETR